MPEYILPRKEYRSFQPAYKLMIDNKPVEIFSLYDLDKFTTGYIEALFFTENSSMDTEQFDLDPSLAEGTIPQDVSWLDFDPNTMENIIKECKAFQDQNYKDLENLYGENLEQAGHDFWLSRNGHGAGFCDRYLDDKENRDINKEIGYALHIKCGWRTDFPEVNVYFQNGKIHI